jgi:hypothetical protein
MHYLMASTKENHEIMGSRNFLWLLGSHKITFGCVSGILINNEAEVSDISLLLTLTTLEFGVREFQMYGDS